MEKPMTIGIVGTGRFATVLRKMFASDGFSIYQSSTTKEIDGKIIHTLSEVVNSEVVFPSVPISCFQQVIQNSVKLLKPNYSGLFVDICSVSSRPNKSLLEILPSNVDIVSSHPLFGPRSSKNGTIFKNLDFIFWPTRLKNTKRWNKILQQFKLLGITSTEMSPEEHDRIMARTQAIAFLYGKLGVDLELHEPRLNTPGYQSIAENQYIVSQDSQQLFWDMFQYNPYAKQTLDRIIDQLTEYQTKIQTLEQTHG